MGSGCLKPPSPPAQLNLSSLDSIYEDIRQQNYVINSNNEQNVQAYKQINERIAKNGKLKKLCDYLSSHRDCICQTVLHCNRLLYQSKCYAHKYVTIIVLDAIFNIGPKLARSGTSKKGFTQISLVQYNSSKVVSVNGSYRESAVRTLVNKEQNERSMANNSMALGKRKVGTEITEQEQAKPSTTLNELTSPIFQSNYFNMINFLVQQDGLLYKLSLQNLIKYCHLCQTPSSTEPHNKFANKNYIGEVMKNISYHIQVNNQMGISLKCYRIMLERMKDEYFNANVDCLGALIDLWISSTSTNTSTHTHLPINSNKSIPPQQTCLSSPEQTQRLLQIIQIFLSSCIEEYQNNTIVQEIFKMLDKYKFRNVDKIENILFDAIEGNELKRQFYKKLLLYLLAYVGYPECGESYEYGSSVLRDQSRFFENGRNHENEENINNMHVLEKQWMECYGLGAPSALAKKYKNIKSTQCKSSCLAKINKWIFVDKIVSIDELLMYSGLCLLNAFIFNLYSDDQSVKDKVVIELATFMNNLPHQGKAKAKESEMRDLMVQVGDMLMMQIEQNRVYDDNVRYTLLSIWESVVKKQKQLKLQQNHGHIILSLNFSYCYQNNVKIISLMSLVLAKISRQSVRTHLERICQFYDSIYKEILTGFTNAQHKIKLIDEFGQLFGTDPQFNKFDRIFYGIYVAFLQKLSKLGGKKQNNKEIHQQNYVYFIDYLAYTLTKILNLGTANPTLLDYRNKIMNSKDAQQLLILQQYNKDRVSTQFALPNKEDIELYRESVEHFRIKQSVEYDMTGTGSVFWKGTQSVESCHSRDSIHSKVDKDLEDVLDILRL